MTRACRLCCLIAVPGLLAGACTRRPAPAPRPDAWPRIAVYEPAYHAERIGPLTLQVNDSARVDSVGPGWFNIVYPAYGITVNCTLTRGDNIGEVLANRLERLERNLGGRPAQQAAWNGRRLIVAPTALKTPVQFLMTDSVGWVLSGVAVSQWNEATAVDSVSPQIEALAADIAFMLK